MLKKWSKKYNKINILGICEWLLKLCNVFHCLRKISDWMADNFSKEPHLLLKNINIIKYQLCGPWNDEKVKQKMIK